MKYVVGRHARIVAIVVIAMGISARDSLGQTVEDVTSWRCDFPVHTVSEWEAVTPNPSIGSEEDFGFNIDAVDLESRTARMIGNSGASDLRAVVGAGSVHFLELTPAGNLVITTIFQGPTEEGMKAVHSRHIGILGTPIVSQYFGYCRVWEGP